MNTLTQLPDPHGCSAYPLTELLRSGAQRRIEHAVETELSVLLPQPKAGSRHGLQADDVSAEEVA